MDKKIVFGFSYVFISVLIMLPFASVDGAIPGSGKGAAYQTAEAMNAATPLSFGSEIIKGLKTLKKSKGFHRLNKGVRAAVRQLNKATTPRAANKARKALAVARSAAQKPVSEVMADASRKAFNSAKANGPISGTGKLLGRASVAAGLYQVGYDAKKGWDKGGAPEALKQGLGTMAGNQVNTEAMVYGASLGAPAGPLGCVVGGLCGYVAVNFPIPGVGGSIKEGVEYLVKNNPVTKALDAAGKIQAERNAWAALSEAERRKRIAEFKGKQDEMMGVMEQSLKERSEMDRIAKELRNKNMGMSEDEAKRQTKALWEWHSEENKKREDKRKAAEEAKKKQAKAGYEKKAPSNKDELIEALRKTGLSEDEARRQAEAMLKMTSEQNKKREEKRKAAAEAEKKKQEADEGWGAAENGYGDDKSKGGGWGDGGYEQLSPADRYIDGIMSATESCDYQQALNLANKALAEDPKNAWLRQNYSTLQLNVRRLNNYNSAIDSAVAALESGNVDVGLAALGMAMENSSTQCGQQNLVKSLLADAERIVKMEEKLKRKADIEKAKWEAEKSAYERNRRRVKYERDQAERKRNARALQNTLMGILGAVTKARSRSSTTGAGNSGVDPYSDDIIQRKVRENERKYGDLMKKYNKSKNSSFTAPRVPRRQISKPAPRSSSNISQSRDKPSGNNAVGGVLAPATGGYECSGPKEFCNENQLK